MFGLKGFLRFISLAPPLLLVAIPLFAADLASETRDRDLDGDIDTYDAGAQAPSPSPAPGNCPLNWRWTAPPSPQNLRDFAIGDPDDDGRMSILVPHYSSPDAILHDFESTGDNTFARVWSSESRSGGIYSAVSIDDLEGDGRNEIIAAQYDFALRTFSEQGDNAYVESLLTPAMDNRTVIRDMVAVDTDGDGIKEVVVLQSRSGVPEIGSVSVHESDGSQGYARITDQYLWRLSSGFFDEDDLLDIFVTGFKATGFSLLWIERDGASFSFRTLEMPGDGLPLASEVADTDGDGTPELLVAGNYDGLRQLVILDAVADNTAEIRTKFSYPSTSNAMDIAVGHVWSGAYPEIAVSTHDSGGQGQIFFFRHDGTDYHPVCHTGSEFNASNGPFYRVEISSVDGDDYADVVIGTGSTVLMLEASSPVTPPSPGSPDGGRPE